MSEHKTRDEGFMRFALQQASLAGQRGEVPVGAVLVSVNGEVLAQAGNAPMAESDPTGHAEIRALRAAAAQLGNYRLVGCTLYVTLEPCPMCMSAIAMARLARVVYGASDERLGACGGGGSALNLAVHSGLNPHTVVEGGLMAGDAASLLKAFFQSRRPDKEGRLERIARLEDIPNVDPDLAQWLRHRGVEEASALSVLVEESVFDAWLQDFDEADHDRRARLKALRHFVNGGAALPWRDFLGQT